MAAMMFERYQDILEYILDFVPKEELGSHAVVSRSLAKVVRRKAGRVRRIRFRGNAFGEDKRWYAKTIQEVFQSNADPGYLEQFVSVIQNQHRESAATTTCSCSSAGDGAEEETLTSQQSDVAVIVPVPISRYNTLYQSLFSLENLRRLDLTMCRVSRPDFRAALQSVSGTLQDLRIEMIYVVGPAHLPMTDMNYTMSSSSTASKTMAGRISRDDRAGGGEILEGSDQAATLSSGADSPSAVQQQQMPSQAAIVPQPYPTIVMKSLRRLDLSPPSTSVLQNITFPKLMRLSSYRKMLEDKCSNCNVARPSSKCGACKFYAFCTRECQMSNWNDNELGHKRVCHHSAEVDSPQSVSGLILSAAKSGELRELDLAHYWHQNVLFAAGGGGAGGLQNEDDDEGDANGPGSGVSGGGGGGQNRASDPAARPDSVVPVFSRPTAIDVLERLVSLRLLRCGVDDNALELIATNATHLRSLDISLNTKVTDEGLAFLSARSETLEDLRLRQDYRLTDAGIRRALVKLPNLTRVDLRSGIKRLRSRGVPHGHLAALPQQQQLNDANSMARSIRITSVTSLETLLALETHCKLLKSIRIVSRDEHNNISTVIPEEMKTKVECDVRGGIDLDEWGESDETYTPEKL